jgi:NAD(P)-dependent dehydrogenase (short-subunit alcohol dehydrogenase family)
VYCIDLSRKHAVVVGGTSGIGRATAELLASAGAEVITLSRRAQPAPLTTSDEVRARISHRVLDVADPAAAKRIFAEIAAEGGVDISVHSAAVAIPAAATDTDDELWRHHMTINVDGGTAPPSVDSRGVNFRPRLRLGCAAVRTLSG